MWLDVNVELQCCYRDSTAGPEEEEVDFVVSGAVDDVVKTWTVQDESLELMHKLEGHSLGVVSVAVNSDSTSKYSQ